MAAADSALAGELGVSAETIEEVRRTLLEEGLHWARTGNRVHFTEAGVAAVRARFELPILAEKKEGAAVLCEIVRIHPNPHFVRVQVPSGALAEVRVRSSAALRMRMRVLCRELEGGQWECCQPGVGVNLPPPPSSGGLDGSRNATRQAVVQEDEGEVPADLPNTNTPGAASVPPQDNHTSK